MSHRRHVQRPYGAEDVNTITKGIAPETFNYEMSVDKALKQGDLELKIGTSAIRSEYQKRLTDVSILRGKAQQTLKNLELEKTVMLRCREDLLVILKDFESTLQVNIDWAKLRKGQQTTMSGVMSEHNHTIGASLESSAKDIKNSLLMITVQLQKLHTALAECDKSIELLRNDIIAKSGSMVLDKACMEGLLLTDLVPASSPRAQGAAGNGPVAKIPSVPSPRRSDADWISKGQEAAVHAQHTIERCTPVRRAAQDLVTEIQESGRLQRNPTVVDAFRHQLRSGEQLNNQIELNRKALLGQISSLTNQSVALQVSLDKVREQLDLARQRLKVSAVRPAMDGAPMNVEDMLKSEIVKLTRNEAELQSKLTGLLRHKERNEAMLVALSEQAVDNKRVTEIAKSCLEVKLPPISSPRSLSSQGPITPRRIR